MRKKLYNLTTFFTQNTEKNWKSLKYTETTEIHWNLEAQKPLQTRVTVSSNDHDPAVGPLGLIT